MKSESIDQIIQTIKQKMSEDLQTSDAEIQDIDLSSMDSINRLTLTVGLENIYNVELMDDNLKPEVYESIKGFAEYIKKRI